MPQDPDVEEARCAMLRSYKCQGQNPGGFHLADLVIPMGKSADEFSGSEDFIGATGMVVNTKTYQGDVLVRFQVRRKTGGRDFVEFGYPADRLSFAFAKSLYVADEEIKKAGE